MAGCRTVDGCVSKPVSIPVHSTVGRRSGAVGFRPLVDIRRSPQDRNVSDDTPRPIGKIEQLARWALWPSATLSVVCLGMLITGAADRLWAWFLPTYVLIGMPLILDGVVGDWTRLRRIWRYLRGDIDDWT